MRFLKNRFIRPDKDIFSDPAFESRVCKIQENRVSTMNEAKIEACSCLLRYVDKTNDEKECHFARSVKIFKKHLSQWKLC